MPYAYPTDPAECNATVDAWLQSAARDDTKQAARQVREVARHALRISPDMGTPKWEIIGCCAALQPFRVEEAFNLRERIQQQHRIKSWVYTAAESAAWPALEDALTAFLACHGID